MPTVNVEVTGTADTTVYKPASYRASKVVFLRAYNRDVNDNLITVKAVRYDSTGSAVTSRQIDVIPLASSQVEVITAEKLAIYDLEKGEALVTTLSTATASFPVYITATFELV